MHSARIFRGAVLLVGTLLLCTGVFASEADDYVPEVTDRVARISFVTGDVQIRRADRQDWEVAVLNLPVVEGDEIATDANGRFEIQFNSYTYLRVAENSQIRIAGLKDTGIALSVPLGTVTLRISEFGRSYFEIDAPRTTISVQKAGVYRVESGVQDSLEVFVSASDGGEARVYSPDGGFTIKNGRRATIFVAGNRTGEWDVADASQFSDEFDSWSLDRDAIIAQRLKDAYYDRYYDRDIYGAEDLNDNGEWIQTRKYGYVWRPYKSSISGYADWSPYRYGHWRWIPSFGWTWVNDEPWGWATYHHGRWVWDDNTWYWTPYAYYRSSRSWWHPALVVVRILGSSVCWYPLPYASHYYDYNSNYHRRRHRGNYGNGGGHVGGGPTPTPTPIPVIPAITAPIRSPIRKVENPIEPTSEVPPGGVVTVPTKDFGIGKGRYGFPTQSVASSVLSRKLDANDPPLILPTYNELGGKVSTEIRSVRAPMVKSNVDVPIGATPRKSDAPLDQELQKTRIFGGRPPLQINTNQGEIKLPAPVEEVPRKAGEEVPRKTGAVQRPIGRQRDDDSSDTPPVKQAPPEKQGAPIYSPPPQKQQEEPVRQPRFEQHTKREDPPSRSESPKRDNPPPRNDPPAKNDPPPRNDPSPRNEPPPQKSEPPPQKSEPSKPDPPAERKKDGRLM